VILAVVLVAELRVVTVNVALVAPEGIVTEAGTVAFDDEDARVTTYPVDGAGLAILTVPVEFALPPITVVGFSVMLVGPSAETDSVALAV
jgi:hypothetical protein